MIRDARPLVRRFRCSAALRSDWQQMCQESFHRRDLQRYRAHSWRRHGLVVRARGNLEGGTAETRRSLEEYIGLKTRSGEDWFEVARCQAALASATRAGQKPAAAAEVEERRALTMGLLRKAVGLDYRALPTFEWVEHSDSTSRIPQLRWRFRFFSRLRVGRV